MRAMALVLALIATPALADVAGTASVIDGDRQCVCQGCWTTDCRWSYPTLAPLESLLPGGAFLCRPTACAAPGGGALCLRRCPAGETV